MLDLVVHRVALKLFVHSAVDQATIVPDDVVAIHLLLFLNVLGVWFVVRGG